MDDPTAWVRGLVVLLGFSMGGLSALLSVSVPGGQASRATHVMAVSAPTDLRAVNEVLFERWRAHGRQLLTINICGDLFFPASVMREFAAETVMAGVNHTHVEMDSEFGHLACLQEPEKFAPYLRALLSS